MAKVLILLAVVGLVLLLVNKARGRASGGQAGADKAGKGAPLKMVACAHCGVHLPQSDALVDAGGRHYCGEPHRVAGPR